MLLHVSKAQTQNIPESPRVHFSGLNTVSFQENMVHRRKVSKKWQRSASTHLRIRFKVALEHALTATTMLTLWLHEVV